VNALFEFESSGGTSILAPPKPRLHPLPAPEELDPPPSGPPDDFDDSGGGYGGWGGDDDADGDDDASPQREAPGPETGSLALGLLLAGITTLFCVLLAVWIFLRRGASDWEPVRAAIPRMGLWSATLLLLASSVAIEHAARIARAALAKDRGRILGWLGFSAALGVAFVGVQVGVLFGMWNDGYLPSSSGYGAVFYALATLHALHILGGLGYELVVAARLRADAGTLVHRHSLRLAAIFWHFMGLLWAILFTLLYLVR